ncbi:MAG: hypothetical protein EPN93_12035 [Spirochaetes bacterium]|nr:MAG: hypothetical protein EPN93_12035 [Spirochaetota bacterium]
MKTRREFLTGVLKAVPLIVAGGAFLTKCGGSSSDNGTDCMSISANHGHTVTVPQADINTGAQVIYPLTSGSGHTHSITVTVTNFTDLQAMTPVTITSTADGSGPHTHDVTISCANG